MTSSNKRANNKDKINLWLSFDICLLVATLLIYGCSSEQKKVTNWNEINYAKVACDSKSDECHSDDVDVTSIVRGGKR